MKKLFLNTEQKWKGYIPSPSSVEPWDIEVVQAYSLHYGWKKSWDFSITCVLQQLKHVFLLAYIFVA